MYKWTHTVQTRVVQGSAVLQRRACDKIRANENSSETLIYLHTRKEIFSSTRSSKPEACGLEEP